MVVVIYFLGKVGTESSATYQNNDVGDWWGWNLAPQNIHVL